MNEHRLFDFLEKQKKADLLELLSAAYATMTTDQRQEVFGGPVVIVGDDDVLAQ